ncbi:MAG: response regulator [Armatimonadetes bacterium]|nr:response regulator [Armatimonadota bacterium]
MRAVVVDRDVAELAWLKPALAELGLAVTVATHGEAALDLVVAAAPDLVLLGVSAQGLDAFEVCRRLAFDRQTAHLPVLMVAHARDETLRLRALDAGAVALLTPPDSRHALVLEMRAVLRRKQAVDACWAQTEQIRNVAAARDALMRISLVDLDTMIGAAGRAVRLVRESAGSAEWPAEERRVLRVAHEELRGAAEAVRALQAVRALDAGEWEFEPAPMDVSSVLEQSLRIAGPRVPVTGSAEPDLMVVADAALVELALTALVQFAAERVTSGSSIQVHALRREPAGVRVEIVVIGDEADLSPTTPIAQALHLTLAQMVAEAHGGSLASGRGGGLSLVLELPPEPTSGTWPPTGLFSKAARAAEGSGLSATATAADWLVSRASLPAPPRPPRLMPPAAD